MKRTVLKPPRTVLSIFVEMFLLTNCICGSIIYLHFHIFYNLIQKAVHKNFA